MLCSAYTLLVLIRFLLDKVVQCEREKIDTNVCKIIARHSVQYLSSIGDAVGWKAKEKGT